MIKFFRKIRQSLLAENKTGKYLIYAIGEITLVMIGILLAMQVNNWNEKRKLSNSVESLFTQFENELEINIEKGNSLIKRGYYKDSVIHRYMNNKITRVDLLNNQDLFLDFSTSTKGFIDDNLDGLIELEKELPKKYKQIIPQLKELKRRIESQRKWEKIVVELSVERNKERVDNLTWVNLRDSLSIEKSISHYLTNPFYKNKILHFNGYDLGENTWDASLIRTSSVALLWAIKNLRKSQDISIDSFLKGFGMIPFQGLECGSHPYKTSEVHHYRSNYIMYNNSDKVVFYNFIDTKGEVVNSKKKRIEPKSFILYETNLNDNFLIELLENNICKKVYRRTTEDYIIIN